MRVTLDEIKSTRPRIDRSRLEATSEEEILRHMIEDGEMPNRPLLPVPKRKGKG